VVAVLVAGFNGVVQLAFLAALKRQIEGRAGFALLRQRILLS
jgi:hypothetical protein